MIEKLMSVVQELYKNNNWQFWFFQFCGWTGYSLVTFFSITYWDNNISVSHVGHIALQAVLGVLSSWPLRPLFRKSFHLPLFQRLTVAIISAIILSAIWTALRMLTFMWVSGESGLWSEYNYWYFGSLFVFMSWTALYYGIKFYQLLVIEHQKLIRESALARKEQSKRFKAESAARNAQLQMLRYQLNPHFLFNTLNSINALVKLEENRKAQEMIQLLSQFLRHSLEQDSVEQVSLEQELATLALYLDIEKVRFEDRLKLDFDVEQKATKALVPGLILQPIFENAMKYAIAVDEEGGSIRLSAKVVDEELHLEISDSGPGLNGDDHGRGIGLRNTRERLEALYENHFTFDTAGADPRGLTIHIHIPYQTAALR